jgi:hypothetical protein
MEILNGWNELKSLLSVFVWNFDATTNLSLLQVLCFYFVFTVFVTVGFGDITAGNTSERVLQLPLPLPY